MVKPQDYNHRKSKVRKTIAKSIHHSKGERARESKISECYYIQPLFQVKAYKLVTRPKEVTMCKLPQQARDKIFITSYGSSGLLVSAGRQETVGNWNF